MGGLWTISLALLTAPGVSTRATLPAAVDVTDHGAVPDDGKDDTRAVQAAVDAAGKRPVPRLLFPRGRYDFVAGANPRDKRAAISVRGINGLSIRGDGATLVGHGLTAMFSVRYAGQFRVEGVTIDWDRPPFSQGTVLASTALSIDVAVDKAYPVKGDEPVQAFGEYDAKARRPRRRGLDVYGNVSSTVLLRPQVLRINLQRPIRPATVGGTVVLRHQVYQYNAFALRNCHDVTLRDVTVYACPGMGLSAYECDVVVLDRMRVMVKPGSGRLMSTTADATHFNSCSGPIRIHDCLFEGMGDDAVNVHGMYMIVRAVEDRVTLLVVPGRRWVSVPRSGDRLEFVAGDTMQPMGTADVKVFRHVNARYVSRLVFRRPVPMRVAKGDLIANLSRVPSLRISRCTVRNNRARGFLIQTRDAKVVGNTFQGCSGAAIHVTCDADYWFESLGTSDVQIRGNLFEDCNYGAAMGEAVIRVFAHLPKRTLAPAGVHRGIGIEANRILRTDNAAVFAASTDGLKIQANLIDKPCQHPTGRIGRSAVYVTNVRNAMVLVNRITGRPAAEGVPAIGVGSGRDTGSVRVFSNTVE